MTIRSAKLPVPRWPFIRMPERVDYGPVLELVQTWLPDAAARRKVLWDTPRRLFGFAG